MYQKPFRIASHLGEHEEGGAYIVDARDQHVLTTNQASSCSKEDYHKYMERNQFILDQLNGVPQIGKVVHLQGGDSRYKTFRNYMVNELGITRADIEEWTQKAVAIKVEKIVGQINMEKLVQNKVAELVKITVFEYGQISKSFKEIVKEILLSDFNISIVKKEQE
jgi:hypothetical protein